MANSLGKLAYQTLQQGKSIAGLAHKELSTKVMELMAPETVPKTEKVSAAMLNALRQSMAPHSTCRGRARCCDELPTSPSAKFDRDVRTIRRVRKGVKRVAVSPPHLRTRMKRVPPHILGCAST